MKILEKPITLGILVIFALIIAVFTALAITYYVIPKSKPVELTLEQKWSSYNNFEIRKGQKVPVGSSEEVITLAPLDTTHYEDPLPDIDTSQTKPIHGTSNLVRSGKTEQTFTWDYHGKSFTLKTWLENSLDYENPKNFVSEADYYSKFLIIKPNDNCIKDVAQKLKAIAQAQRLTSDQFLELIATFVQSSIPYVDGGSNPPKFPYQTLKDGSGDCDDKSLLAYKLMEENGYSVALISYPTHMAVGIGCPKPGSLDNSGFAYLEISGPTKWPIGQMPIERVGQSYSIILPHVGTKIYHSLGNPTV